MVVVATFNCASAFHRLVVVLGWCVVSNDGLQQLKLDTHRVVQSCLHRCADLQSALKNSECSTHWSLSAHVADVDVTSRRKATTFLNDLIKQLEQSLAWLFVWQRQDVVTYGA